MSTAETSMTDEHKAIVRQWFALFNTGDFSALEAIHSDDCRNHAPGPFDVEPWPAEGRTFGRDEFRGTVEWIRRNQPDLRVEVEHLVCEADQVVAWVRAAGTPTGVGGPIPPTGRRVDFAQAHRFRIRNGRVVEHWAVRDDLRSLIQAGVVTPPAGPPA
jgi:predicted ester cyclase